MTRSTFWRLIALAGLLALACQPPAVHPVSRPPASPVAAQPLVIGAILDVGEDSGPNGWQRFEAATHAVELVNRRGGVLLLSGERRSLALTVYDDAGQPERAQLALQRLIEDGALAVIGPSTPASAAAVRTSAEAAAIPLIALDPTSGREQARWRWTFTLAAPPEAALAATLDFFVASGVDRFGWLAPRTMESATLRRTLVRLATAANMQLVGEEVYAPGEEEHTQRLARLQAGDPRVILAWPRDSHEAAAIAREAAKIRDLVPIFVGPAGGSLATLERAAAAADGLRTVTLRLPVSDDLWDHDPLTPVIRDFRRELESKTGRPPSSEAAGAWDATRLIVSAIERPTSGRADPSRAAIRDAIEATVDYLGASGAITFGPDDHDGLDRRALIVARAEARRWRLPP